MALRYPSENWDPGIQLNAGDIEIGAVELKNSTDDTRAVVGANGLYTDVRAIQAGVAKIGFATVNVAAGVAWAGFATVAVGSSATIYNVAGLAAGLSYIGSATVNNAAGSSWIGLVSTASVQGKAELVASTANIGFATVSLGAGVSWIGFVSTATINADANLKTLIAGEDQTNDVLKTEDQFSYATFTGNSTAAVKSATGFLHCVNIGAVSNPTITLWDNTVPSGTAIHVFEPGNLPGTYGFNVKFATGLSVAAAAGAAARLELSYR